jgi:thioredoxin-related protein
MLFFDAKGCAYCKAFLERTLGEPGLQSDVRAHFDVVGLDMFSDIEVKDFSGRRLALKDFAVREGATVSPTVLF